MKELKPFSSPRTSSSFPEVEAAILIFLELAKKFPISTPKTAHTPYFFASLFPQLCPNKHTVCSRYKAHESAEPPYSLRGSAPFIKHLRNS